jgi:hypothetical protein
MIAIAAPNAIAMADQSTFDISVCDIQSKTGKAGL